MALLLHLLAQQHTDGHRAGEVHLCGLHGELLVLPLLLVIAQDSERDDRDVDIAGLEGLVDDRRVRIEIHGIEWQGLHLGCTGSLAAADGFVQALAVAGSEHHARRATGQELFDYGQAHVGRTAEQQDGLWLSNSINHEITPLKGSSVFSAARGGGTYRKRTHPSGRCSGGSPANQADLGTSCGSSPRRCGTPSPGTGDRRTP